MPRYHRPHDSIWRAVRDTGLPALVTGGAAVLGAWSASSRAIPQQQASVIPFSSTKAFRRRTGGASTTSYKGSRGHEPRQRQRRVSTGPRDAPLQIDFKAAEEDEEPEPMQIDDGGRRSRQRVYRSYGYLSKLRRRGYSRRGRRRVRVRGRRSFRRRRRIVKRRRFRSRKSFGWKVLKAIAPTTNYSADWGIAIRGTLGAKTVFVPCADNGNYVDQASLGTSIDPDDGHSNVDPYQMCIDTPDQVVYHDNCAVWSTTGLIVNPPGTDEGVSGKIFNTGGVGTSVYSNNYYYGARRFKWIISNQQLHPINLRIHWCVARHDVAKAVDTESPINSKLSYRNYIESAQDINDLVMQCFYADEITGQTNTSDPGTMKTFQLSFSPYQSPTFCRYFKIKKSNTYELNAGQCMTFALKRKKPWRLSYYQLATAQNTLLWARRSMFPLFEMYGCSVLDNGPAGEPSLSFNLENSGAPVLTMRFQYATTVKNVMAGALAYHWYAAGQPAGAPAGADGHNVYYVSKPIAQGILPE